MITISQDPEHNIHTHTALLNNSEYTDESKRFRSADAPAGLRVPTWLLVGAGVR